MNGAPPLRRVEPAPADFAWCGEEFCGFPDADCRRCDNSCLDRSQHAHRTGKTTTVLGPPDPNGARTMRRARAVYVPRGCTCGESTPHLH